MNSFGTYCPIINNVCQERSGCGGCEAYITLRKTPLKIKEEIK